SGSRMPRTYCMTPSRKRSCRQKSKSTKGHCTVGARRTRRYTTRSRRRRPGVACWRCSRPHWRKQRRMPTYAAFLRGVTPLNAKMSELKKCFEAAGLTDVRTVLGSGNAVFETRSAARATLERKLEAAMEKDLRRVFATTVRSIDELEALLAS